ncbi:MAG: undecaprenyl-diphosphate phosphatase, partial [Devosiaceae bacterium]|nr:undecaprenyl-diphosphate phosphatase [Devosiaceae bacterium]
MDQGIFVPLVLGIIEGLTEFLPVSSTAHLLLAGHFFGLSQPATFIVLIQLGAIFAILTIYFSKIFSLIKAALQGEKHAWLFALNVALASIPAAFAGVLAHDFIQSVLYESALTICIMLVLGGIILLIVDRLPLKVKYTDIYTYPWHLSLIIGLFQMLALIPGVSRSGATVVGSLLFGPDKRSAAEFNFF